MADEAPQKPGWLRTLERHPDRIPAAKKIYEKAVELGADPHEALTTAYHEAKLDNRAGVRRGSEYQGAFQLNDTYDIDRTDPEAATEAWWNQRKDAPESGYEYYRKEHNLGAPLNNTLEYHRSGGTRGRRRVGNRRLESTLVNQPVFGRALADRYNLPYRGRGWTAEEQTILDRARQDYGNDRARMANDFVDAQQGRWDKSAQRMDVLSDVMYPGPMPQDEAQPQQDMPQPDSPRVQERVLESIRRSQEGMSDLVRASFELRERRRRGGQ
jgi:hypothetical protein